MWEKKRKRNFKDLLSFHLQQNSAADLSMLVLEVLEKSETKVEEEILGETLQHTLYIHPLIA